MTTTSPILWVLFNVFIILLLLLDAYVLAPKGKDLSMRRSMGLTAFWVTLALLFNVYIYYWLGSQRALEFLSGYLIEQSLSVDNIFIFLLIFSHFKLSQSQQHKALLIGVVSAQVMRALFIIGGVALLNHFHWMIYVFGLILIITGFKLFFKKEEEIDPEHNPIIKLIGKKLPIFWVVIVLIETTDLIFAIDSIPAVLAITKDPFIAYTSNIFAILGLRAMYFALASLIKKLCYLHYGLGVILLFVGFKMLTEQSLHIPVQLTLLFIFVTLAITVLSSTLCPPKPKK